MQGKTNRMKDRWISNFLSHSSKGAYQELVRLFNMFMFTRRTSLGLSDWIRTRSFVLFHSEYYTSTIFYTHLRMTRIPIVPVNIVNGHTAHGMLGETI